MKGEEKAKGGGMLYGLSFMLFFIGFAMIIFFGGTANMVLLIFVLFGSISMLAGINMTAEPRSYLGLPFILMFLFIFTSQQPAIMGQAIFGYWWPQVQSFSDTYMPPLTNALDQAWKSLSKVGKMMTDPAGYFRDIQMENQATKTITFNSPSSIEINKVDLFTTTIGTLDPNDDVTGVISIENKGDFECNGVNITISASWVNPEDNTEHPTGSIERVECSPATTKSDGSAGSKAYCNWTFTTYPKESKISSFNLKRKSWTIDVGDGDLSKCKDNVKDDCNCFTSDCNANVTYTHSGQIVKFNTNITYTYYVNVSIPFEIMKQEIYNNKLRNGENVLLTNITSIYTGGPVMATIFLPYQPARTELVQPVIASIYNNGQGEITRINNFTLIFYGQEITEVEKISSTFKDGNYDTDGCGEPSQDSSKNFWKITCKNTYGTLKPQQYKRVSFYVNTSDISLQKTTQITGLANYDYVKTSSQSLVIANAPPI